MYYDIMVFVNIVAINNEVTEVFMCVCVYIYIYIETQVLWIIIESN